MPSVTPLWILSHSPLSLFLPDFWILHFVSSLLALLLFTEPYPSFLPLTSIYYRPKQNLMAPPCLCSFLLDPILPFFYPLFLLSHSDPSPLSSVNPRWILSYLLALCLYSLASSYLPSFVSTPRSILLLPLCTFTPILFLKILSSFLESCYSLLALLLFFFKSYPFLFLSAPPFLLTHYPSQHYIIPYATAS